jgi:membrane protein
MIKEGRLRQPRKLPTSRRLLVLRFSVVLRRLAHAASSDAHVYGAEDRRDFVSFNLHALALGAGLALFGVTALALVAVLPAALAFLPVSDAWGDVLGLVRWPILAGIVTLALAIVYRYAPNRAERKWEWISWGSVAATALWILGSIAFTIYVSKVGSYDKTYGSLGAVIILLLWFYLTAYVILAGAELNAEIERQTTRGAVCSPDPLDSGGYARTQEEF